MTLTVMSACRKATWTVSKVQIKAVVWVVQDLWGYVNMGMYNKITLVRKLRGIQKKLAGITGGAV